MKTIEHPLTSIKETKKHFENFARYAPKQSRLYLDGQWLIVVHRNEFDKNIKIDKKDFSAIEFLLRKGQRQLDMYSSPGIKDIR